MTSGKTPKPYPAHLETDIEHRGRKVHIRPVRPDDEALVVEAASTRLTTDDLRLRFFAPVRDVRQPMGARLTHVDYDREMAFMMFEEGTLVGTGRLVADDRFEEAEFALAIAHDAQRRGYGELMLRHIVDYARTRHIKRVVAHVRRENTGMIAVAERVGFVRTRGVSMGSELRVEKVL
jgi:acetyltransferase